RFHVDVHHYTGQVIWAIGCSMIALAGLIWLPRTVLAVVAGAMIFLHNLTDSVRPENLGPFANVWRLLHVQSDVRISPDIHFFAGYPLIPWIGVMAAGYLFAPVFLREPNVRRKRLLFGGAVVTILFITLRAANFYGDPQPWSLQKNFL